LLGAAGGIYGIYSVGRDISNGNWDETAYDVGCLTGAGLVTGIGALADGWAWDQDMADKLNFDLGSLWDWLGTLPTDSGWDMVGGGIGAGFGELLFEPDCPY
jgi:hypothetical protein